MVEIKIKIVTKSNCLIGNQTESFSIGGVDQSTIIDKNGKPIIYGSSFKGAFRNIVRENENEMPKTKEYIKEILEYLLEEYNQKGLDIKFEKLVKKIKQYINTPKAEYIFGIEGLNGMPRVFCTDFILSSENTCKDYFLIETKTSLEEKNGEILSRPRTYKVIKPEVIFEGLIRFQNNYYKPNKVDIKEVETELKNILWKFNGGFYGIGNSKSRGYGLIEVTVIN